MAYTQRRLLESRSASGDQNTEVSVVQTPEQLAAAVEEGFEHIEIQNHMSLLQLPLRASANDTEALLVMPATIRSLTGNCTSDLLPDFSTQLPDRSPLLNIKPSQCLVLFSEPLLSVPPSDNSDGRLWLDNLYFRYVPPAGLGSVEEEQTSDSKVVVVQLRSGLEPSGSSANPKPSERSPKAVSGDEGAATARPLDSLWMTNVTIQGDGGRPLEGAQIQGRVYAEDCVFSHLGPDVPSIRVAEDEASGAFHSCTFQNFLANNSAVGILEASGSSGLLIKGSEFLENDVDALFLANDTAGAPLIYSDESNEVVSKVVGKDSTPLPLAALGSSEIEFLQSDVGGDPAVAQEVERGNRVVRLIRNQELGAMTIVAIVLSCVILFCCSMVGIMAWFQRHSDESGWRSTKLTKSSKLTRSSPDVAARDKDPPCARHANSPQAPRRWRPNPVSESIGRQNIFRQNIVRRDPTLAHGIGIGNIAIARPGIGLSDFTPLSSPMSATTSPHSIHSMHSSQHGDGSIGGGSSYNRAIHSAISTSFGPVSPSRLQRDREPLDSVSSLSLDLDAPGTCGEIFRPNSLTTKPPAL